MLAGRLFHAAGPATEKALNPRRVHNYLLHRFTYHIVHCLIICYEIHYTTDTCLGVACESNGHAQQILLSPKIYVKSEKYTNLSATRKAVEV